MSSTASSVSSGSTARFTTNSGTSSALLKRSSAARRRMIAASGTRFLPDAAMPQRTCRGCEVVCLSGAAGLLIPKSSSEARFMRIRSERTLGSIPISMAPPRQHVQPWSHRFLRCGLQSGCLIRYGTPCAEKPGQFVKFVCDFRVCRRLVLFPVGKMPALMRVFSDLWKATNGNLDAMEWLLLGQSLIRASIPLPSSKHYCHETDHKPFHGR